jgi:integrase
MAPRFSKSVLSKIRVYFNSILDEAVELEMLPKNPAGKLAVPRSGKQSATKHLTPEQIPLIQFRLSDRDRPIVRMLLVLGLRGGEMFALRWNDKQGNSLRIDSSITDGMEVDTKTEGGDSFVWLPASIDTELEFWQGTTPDAGPDAFIFPSSRGTAINTNNFFSVSSKKPAAVPESRASRIKCSGARARRTWPKSQASRTCRPTCGTRTPKLRWSITSNRCPRA